MSPRDIIIEYLEYAESKSCTMVGIYILCEEFRISKGVLSFTLTEMVTHGDITIEVQDPEYLTTIKLIPKFKILQ